MRGPRAIPLVLFAVALAACQARAPRVRAPVAGADEGELYVYLQPLPPGAERVELALESLAVVGEGGAELPLAVRPRDPSRRAAPGNQRLLATGVVPVGQYSALVLRIARATLGAGAGERPADLLVVQEPIRIEVPFVVRARAGRVLWVTVRPATGGAPQFAFDAGLTATTALPAASDVVSWASLPDRDTVVAFDKRGRQVFGLLHAGREPRGIAVDALARRAFVALARSDEVAIFDAGAGEEEAHISLHPTDGPVDLALVEDGRVLLVLNAGSRTVAFVDTAARLEVGRVPVGDGPVGLVVNRAGTRAFVLNASPASITVLDVASRRVAQTAALVAEPAWADVDRAVRRLYVAERGSPFLSVLALPDLSLANRVFVGLGVTHVKVDPRTDLVYLSRDDAHWIEVLDPMSSVVIDRIDLPGSAEAVHVDDAQNALFATIPSLEGIAVVDLTSKRVLTLIPLGAAPGDVAIPGER
jgi:DNA-binding beta-propeller fold protein YncE